MHHSELLADPSRLRALRATGLLDRDPSPSLDRLRSLAPRVAGAPVPLGRLAEAARSWADHLEEALIGALGEQQGVRTLRRFERSFPPSYQRHFSAETAVFDIQRIEDAIARNDLAMDL